MIDHVKTYIECVEKGEIIVGKKIQKAINRHKKDIIRSQNTDWDFHYDVKQTINIIKFISMLPDPKTGKPNKLTKHQKFILAMIWGWRNKSDNTRRFKKVYLSKARKQGKSLLVSGISLYCLLYERNPKKSRQVYSTANTRDQAKIVFKMVKSQLRAIRKNSKGIRNFTKVLQHEIITTDESFMKPLSADAETLDGLDAFLAIFDEYAYSKTTEMMEVIETSTAQQDESLILIISTASSKLNYPMHAIEYQYVEKLLNEETENDEYLALCWEQDSIKEVENPELWIKSNPLMEIKKQKEKLTKGHKRLLSEAKAKGTISNILTKYFNIWVQSSKESYMNKEEWSAAKANDYLRDINLFGRNIYVGIDLSRVSDLTSISWIIPIEEKKIFLANSYSFVGSKGGIENKENEDKTPYRSYEDAGVCSISTQPSGLVDYKDMFVWIDEFIQHNEFNVKAICYDPYNAGQMITDLSDTYGDYLVETRQGAITLSPATKQLKIDILNKKLRHTGNQLLDRAIYNAVSIEKNDSLVIDKTTNRNKIDPLDALINAYTQAQYHDFDEVNVNDLIESGDYGFGW